MKEIPGLIDVHVHFRTPGQTHKEDFTTGTSAAIAGGFTTVLDMPNNAIPITTTTLLEEKIRLAKKQAICDIGFHFGSLGNNLGQFQKIKKKVFGIKLYLNITTGKFIIDEKKLKEIYNRWPKDAGPILVHAEKDVIDIVISVAKETKKQTHVCHVSSIYELKAVIKAKKHNIKITCGVTPHHLFLSPAQAKKLGPYGIMKPPIEKGYMEFLWKNLKYIDVIESDHAPHTEKEKDGENPPFGVPGLETTLPLLLTAVHEGRLTMEDIVRLCYENPKKIFRVPDQDARVEIDPDEEYVIKNEDLFTKCGWSPFEGRKMRGRVKRVILRNKVVFENGKIKVKPGFGKVIKPI